MTNKLKLLGLAVGLAAGAQAGTINKDLAQNWTFDSDFKSAQALESTAVGEPTLTAGKIGKAIHLVTSKDGSTNNVLNLGTGGSLNFGGDANGDTTDFSVSFWVNYNAHSTGDQPFISNKNWGSGGNRGWGIFSQNSGSFKWNWRDDVSGRRDSTIPSSNVIRDGQWHHILVAFQRTSAAITYLDGNQIDSASIAPDADQPVGTVDTEADGLSLFLGNDGTGAYTDNGSSEIDMLIDDLGIWRRALTSIEAGRIYQAGLTGVSLANIPDPSTPFVGTSVPGAAALRVSPSVAISFDIQDGSTKLDKASVEMSFDGAKIVPGIQAVSATNTVISYDPPGMLKSGSSHTVSLVFSDNGIPATRKTNEIQFTVANYVDIALPAPIHLETFDSLQDGELPAGWSVSNFTTEDMPGPDFYAHKSDTYKDWTVIGQETWQQLSANFGDLYNLTNMAPDQYINGLAITNLQSKNFILAESDGRSGSQIQYLFTKDFDLTGKTNIFVSYHSIYVQNQDSIGALEYSVDQGATWLPVVYMINAADIVKDSNGAVDAVATLNATYTDVATYTDPDTGEPRGGYYGAFIGAAVTANLAPYISGRIDDDKSSSMLVEYYRLPSADNQSKVRFRFAQAGTDSWYWAVDDFGLYSITVVNPPQVSVASDKVSAAAGNSAALLAIASGAGPFSYQWRYNGADIEGATNASYSLAIVTQANAGAYQVKVTNAGGTVQSGTITLSVFESTAKVTGQWDFDQGDLRATVGIALAPYDDQVGGATQFGTTASFGIPDIGGKSANVMLVPETVSPMTGYLLKHGAAANGGGLYVNQYTLIMDVLYPASSDARYRVFLQTSANNGNDGDFFVNGANGIGISGNYQGVISPDAWHRVAFAVDLAGPGPFPVVAKFIDGVKVGEQTLSAGVDGRWSLNTASDATAPYALLFADDDGDNALTYVNSVQFLDGRLSDAAIAALGAPASTGIPLPTAAAPSIAVSKSGANILISWPESASGYVLQAATSLSGASWSPAAGTSATSAGKVTVTLPITAGNQFFRLKK
jgi:hypothetical protein